MSEVNMKVGLASKDDLAIIMSWLMDEPWHRNFHIGDHEKAVRLAYHSDVLYVAKSAYGEIVALSVGRYNPNLLYVRHGKRNKGAGSSLVKASVARAEADNVNCLTVECEPSSSAGFWTEMGFAPYNDLARPHSIMMRRVLGRELTLPGDPDVPVSVIWHPEAAIHGTQINSLYGVDQTGALKNGKLHLYRRVIGLSDDEPARQNLAVEIIVRGERLCLCKANDDEARALGVRRDRNGDFFIDQVNIAA